MTGAIVTQSGQMPFPTMAGPGAAESSGGDFKEVFQVVADKPECAAEVSKSEKTSVPRTRVEKDSSKNFREDKLETGTVTNKTEDELSKEDMEAVMSCLQELKEEIMATLSVSEEELEQMMDSLGISDADLFSQAGISELILGFAGAESVVDLLTNEEAYDMLTQLTDFAEDLIGNLEEDFQISKEDLENLLKELSGEATEEADVLETKQIMSESSSDEEMVLHTETEVSEITKEPIRENEGETNSETGERQMFGGVTNGANAIHVTNSSNAVTAFQDALGMQDMSTQEIYDQIAEYMRSNISADTSEVEMQLNPENLGKLNIHLTSKQGEVSAHFIAQNEVVKAVLETQMLQLKEQFEQQGMKVDAIEVTVASYSFDQGMNEEQGDGTREANAARKTVIRRLNLNEDLTEEMLSEEEQIAVEMMTANGNTVDFKA